jgi:hypothetical protein
MRGKRKVRIQEREREFKGKIEGERKRLRETNAVPVNDSAFAKDPSNSFERPKSPFVPLSHSHNNKQKKGRRNEMKRQGKRKRRGRQANFEMVCVEHEDIVWFEVSVDDIQFVEGFNSTGKLSNHSPYFLISINTKGKEFKVKGNREEERMRRQTHSVMVCFTSFIFSMYSARVPSSQSSITMFRNPLSINVSTTRTTNGELILIPISASAATCAFPFFGAVCFIANI